MEEAIRELEHIRDLGATNENVESIERGLTTIHAGLGLDPGFLVEWRKILRA